MHEALFWKEKDDAIVCELCPRLCVMKDKQIGACGVRQVHDGKLYAMTYAKPCSMGVDPIEKKPMYHFYPGAPIFSLATIGCNLFCDFCQNWQISKARVDELQEQDDVSPEKIIELTKENGCKLIAFTYTEPTIFYEYMLDIAKLAKKEKIECMIVSNGYIMEEPLKKLIPYISAANIDMKGTKEFYKKRCKVPDYEFIRKTIMTLKKAGVHVEVTNLIIPGENDTEEEFEKMARWVVEHVGKDTPMHFSAFHPHYKMEDTPATSVEILLKAREIAKKHVDYVYLGNVSGVDNDTLCPKCDALCIERPIYGGTSKLKDGKCPKCGYAINGRFSGKKGK
ncbi:AmmeMemoRadiSam system radical SAM enzyme [Candidatus Woesearchaeota archaeon]|nr:AmmeMemoRadiSam system radical SAM enzyme [Candidatus Woesearchaeota archaeon]